MTEQEAYIHLVKCILTLVIVIPIGWYLGNRYLGKWLAYLILVLHFKFKFKPSNHELSAYKSYLKKTMQRKP